MAARRHLLSLAFGIFLCLGILAGLTGHSRGDWLSDMVEGVPPSAGSYAGNVWLYGGKLRVYPTIRSYRPFMVTPPHLFSTPCGFDLFFGGFSMLRPEALVALAQGVISAAPAYAFNLALGQLCSQCQTTMQHLNSIVAKINSLGFNSCQVLKRIGDPLTEGIAAKADTGAINGVFGAINKRLEKVDQDLSSVLRFVSGQEDGKNTTIAKEWADFFINGFSGAGGDQFYLLRQAFVVFDVRRSYTDGSFRTDYPFDTVKARFRNAANFEGFIRAIVGDVLVKKGRPGNCDDSITDLFGSCLTSWITGGTCGNCEGSGAMSAEVKTSPVSPQLPDAKTEGKKDSPAILKADWTAVTFKNGGTEIKWSMEKDLFEGNEGNHKIFAYHPGSDPTLINLSFPAPNMKEYVKNKFEALRANIRNTGATSTISGSEYLVLKDALAIYYAAVRIAKLYGVDYYEEQIADKLSEILAEVYIAGSVHNAVAAGKLVLQNLKNLMGLVPPDKVNTVCNGCRDIVDWCNEGITKLTRFDAFLMSKVNRDLDELNALLEKFKNLNVAENVNKGSAKKEGKEGPEKEK